MNLGGLANVEGGKQDGYRERAGEVMTSARRGGDERRKTKIYLVREYISSAPKHQVGGTRGKILGNKYTWANRTDIK